MSLGTGAALKLLKTVSNVYHILAIEYLLAAQALAFHGEAQLASGNPPRLETSASDYTLLARGSLAGAGDCPRGAGPSNPDAGGALRFISAAHPDAPGQTAAPQ